MVELGPHGVVCSRIGENSLYCQLDGGLAPVESRTEMLRPPFRGPKNHSTTGHEPKTLEMARPPYNSVLYGGQDMKSRIFVFSVLSALCLVGIGATGTLMATAGTGLSGDILIGAVWSLTGDAAVYGPSQKNAAALAVDEINKSGMLGAAKLKLMTEDDRSTKEGAIAAFDRLIKKEKVIAILGPTLSNSAKAADPIAQDAKVVVLGVSNTAGGIVEIGDFIFRDSLPEFAVQPNTIKVTMDKLGYKKVAGTVRRR